LPRRQYLAQHRPIVDAVVPRAAAPQINLNNAVVGQCAHTNGRKSGYLRTRLRAMRHLPSPTRNQRRANPVPPRNKRQACAGNSAVRHDLALPFDRPRATNLRRLLASRNTRYRQSVSLSHGFNPQISANMLRARITLSENHNPDVKTGRLKLN
jgi:hypothetical protein